MRLKKVLKMKRLISLFWICGLVLLCTIPLLAGTTSGETLATADAEILDPGYYWSQSFTAKKSVTLTVTIQSTQAIDVFLLDYNDFGEYESLVNGDRESFTYYVAGSKLSVTQVTYTFTTPAEGMYYVIVDNTEQPAGGASGSSQAKVTLKITYDETSGGDDDDDDGGICGGVIVLIGLICVTAVVIYIKKH